MADKKVVSHEELRAGIDMVKGAYHFLDLAPKGRDEDGFNFSMEWVRRHDQY
jgi:predicted dithiol-disulfide oxidoreductase (DUF899 family)